MSRHVLQSSEWATFRLTTPSVKKVLKIGPNHIFIHKIPLLPFTVAYLPRPEALNNLEEIKKACQKEKAIFLKIEPALGSRFQVLGSRLGKPVLPQHTIYIDLTRTEDEILAGMHEKTRYNLRLAGKKGVVVRQENSPENFIKILEETERRQGFYSHYPDYYRKLWEIIKPTILTAFVKNIPIAAIMLFNYDGVLYYPYGGSNPNFREYMAPHLLHWEAIKLGRKLGCKTYDLWGTYKEKKDESDPWWGIYRFKAGFGDQEVDFPPTVDIPLSPLYPLFSLLDNLRWKILKILR